MKKNYKSSMLYYIVYRWC